MFIIHPELWFQNFSPEWAVFLLSMIPITELRASLPMALTVYHIVLWKALLLTIVGNMVPVAALLLIIPRIHSWILTRSFIGPLFQKRLEKAEQAFSGKFAKYGAIALVIFIGIPLPMTGAWTGALIAFIFNIPFKKSFPLILIGVCLAATIVACVTLFAEGAIQRLFLG